MASTSQPLPAYSPDTCMFCHQSLRITTSADTDTDFDFGQGEAATVIDDVELYCDPPGSGPGGHHAHWTCLIEHAMQARAGAVVPGPSFTTCRVCGRNVLDPSGRFVVDVRNEGGETKEFDFGVIIVRRRRLLFTFLSLVPSPFFRLPSLLIGVFVCENGADLDTIGYPCQRSPMAIVSGSNLDYPIPTFLPPPQEEELFLDSNPTQIHIRAFHDLVAEGDYTGAIELIAEHDVDLSSTYGNEGLTALQKAMFSGDTSGVEFLKSLGATG